MNYFHIVYVGVLLATSASAEMLPLAETRDHRFGGIITHPATHEELFLGCVEKSPQGQCIQFRFIAQSGEQIRILGNQEVEPFELSSQRISVAVPEARSEKSGSAVQWIGKGFHEVYSSESEELPFMIWTITSARTAFSSLVPGIGIPGVGSVVIIGCFLYDGVRLTVMAPIRLVRSIFQNAGKHRLDDAYASLFDSRLRMTSQTLALKSLQFERLKKELVRLSSQTPALLTTN